VLILTTEPWDVAPFVAEQKYTMPFAYDQGGAQLLGLTAIPHTYFINRNGAIVDDHVGALTPAQLDLLAKQIL
jgi:hypothetical protein